MAIENKYFAYGPFGVRLTGVIAFFFHPWVPDPMFWLWKRQHYFFIDLSMHIRLVGYHPTFTRYFLPTDDVTELSVSQLHLTIGYMAQVNAMVGVNCLIYFSSF